MLSRGPVATAAENEGQNNKTDFRDLHRPTISVSIEFAEFEIVKKMKEDRKIREFFHSVRPEVPDNGRFMSEFVRQVSLLPEPASFTKKQDQPGIEAVSSLIRISGQLKKQSVCLAVVACLAAVAMSFLIAVIVSAVPAVDFQQFLAGTDTAPAGSHTDGFINLAESLAGMFAAVLSDWRLVLVSLLTLGSLYIGIRRFAE